MTTNKHCQVTYSPSHRLVLFLMIFISCSSSFAEENSQDVTFMVVMNSAKADRHVSKQHIRQIFMGGTLSRKYQAFNLPVGHQVRIQFNTKIIGLTESRIQSYWAQMKFTGRSEPPIEVDSIEGLLQLVLQTEGAVAYLPVNTEIPNSLTVIYP